MDNNLPHSSHYATISFDLEDPEAEKKLKRMLNVDDYISVLFNFKTDVLRKYFKYEEGNKVRFKPRGANIKRLSLITTRWNISRISSIH